MPVTFDKSAARYRDEKGHFVADNFVRGSVERAVALLEKNLRAAAADLKNGAINIAEFQTKAAEQIKTAHILNAAIGKGGRRQMSASDWGRVGSAIRTEYKFLNKFAREIERGEVSLSQIENRIALYSKAARSVYFKFEKLVKTEIGLLFARRVLNAFENCRDCAYWASRGFIPIEEQPDIGSLICKSFCKCWLEYAASADVLPKGRKSKGHFFIRETNYPYEPENPATGQMNEDSCVAAAIRMILNDNGLEEVEAYIRNSIGTTEEGTSLSNTVKFINEQINDKTYVYKNNLTFEELQNSVKKGSAIVNVRTELYAHSLVVDKIEDGKVFLRDPLPEGVGSAYAVDEKTFLGYWLKNDKKHGISVIIKSDD